MMTLLNAVAKSEALWCHVHQLPAELFTSCNSNVSIATVFSDLGVWILTMSTWEMDFAVS